MKYNYMMALHDRFFHASMCEDLQHEIEANCKKLRQSLSKEDRRCLMRVIDAEAALCDRVSVGSFTSGFKLACGIVKEITADGLYSFDAEEEANVIAEIERRQEKEVEEGASEDDNTIP